MCMQTDKIDWLKQGSRNWVAFKKWLRFGYGFRRALVVINIFLRFQLLAVMTPVVLFHFYAARVAAEIQLLKDVDAIKAEEGRMNDLLVRICLYAVALYAISSGSILTYPSNNSKMSRRKTAVRKGLFHENLTALGILYVGLRYRCWDILGRTSSVDYR